MVAVESSRTISPLNFEQIEGFREHATRQRFETGRQIFKEGDPGDGVYFVESGTVEISSLVAPETRHVFFQAGPGDFFGEMAVLDSKARSACAMARDETVVHFVTREKMLLLLERSPALSLALLHEISNRLREFNRQYVRELLQAERLAVVGRLARSIVHDLKNPLNIISITAEMSGMEHATAEYRQEARLRIRKQVERISDLISEILDFTQTSHAGFILAPADYNEFVRQLVEELRPEAALRGATLELEIKEPGPCPLLLNPKRLRRIFYNLTQNATDAMDGSGTIYVRVINRPEEVVTEIEDTGPGIAPEIASQLFQAFATHGKAHGTGLGLSICKRIIEDHQGWIRARTEAGGGAIFSFGLPRPRQAPAQSPG